MMDEDIRPETNIEWLWTMDLVGLCGEIQRYRPLTSVIGPSKEGLDAVSGLGSAHGGLPLLSKIQVPMRWIEFIAPSGRLKSELTEIGLAFHTVEIDAY